MPKLDLLRKMSQKSSTTTTSFIISSNESLNKRPLSSSQSTDSSDNMTASDSTQNNRYFVSLNPVNGLNNTMLDQQSRQYSSSAMLPPQSPSQNSQGTIYNNSSNVPTMNSAHTSPRHSQVLFSQSATLNGNHCNGNGDDATSMIYASYNRNNNLHSTGPTVDVNILQHQQSGVSSNESNLPFEQELKINGNQQQQGNNCNTYSPKSKSSVHSFHNSNNNKNVTSTSSNHRTSISSIDSSVSNSLMPLNVKSMLLHGVANHEIMHTWLTSIKCEEYLKNFVDHGYDMPLLTRMTPQDLTAIGCKSPSLRKKLLLEIKKLNIEDDIPECRPHGLGQWLELLKLSDYYAQLCAEGYNSIDKVCELTWEDLEEIGINKLGHQKRLLLGIEKIHNFDKQHEERQNDYAIYDVHPNHRMSLHQNSSDNRFSTLGRSTVRSGFFQTRSGANLDHRGLPVATVMPALKHVSNSLANLDISNQTISTADTSKSTSLKDDANGNNRLPELCNQIQPIYQATAANNEQFLKMSDLSTTIKRNPPPLPPVRTNSLKVPQDSGERASCMSIYGNNYGTTPNNGGTYLAPTGSTSFLRTPKLGTLTATTNKMLSHGGYIQSLVGQPQTIRTSLPVREAPLPPVPTTLPPLNIPAKIEEESMPISNYQATSINTIGCPNLANQQIPHQLASADEFPPPPPSQ